MEVDHVVGDYKCTFKNLPPIFQGHESLVCNAITTKYTDFTSMVENYWDRHCSNHNSDRGCVNSVPIEIMFNTYEFNDSGFIKVEMILMRRLNKRICYENCGKINVIVNLCE